MDKKEMAAEFRALLRRIDEDDNATAWTLCKAAADALEREAAAGEPKKVTLEEMVTCVRQHCTCHLPGGHAAGIASLDVRTAAAATLERLRVEGGKLLQKLDEWHPEPGSPVSLIATFIRSLGVEPIK